MTEKQAFYWVKVAIAPVRSTYKDSAEMVTQLLFGELVESIEGYNNWIKVKSLHDEYEGWIDMKQVIPISEERKSKLLKNGYRQQSLLLQLNSHWGPMNTVKGSWLPLNETRFSINDKNFELTNNSSVYNSKDISSIAMEFLNAPYLWGGRTPFGIDCSGFTQAVFSFLGVQLLRDASQQVYQGKDISFDELQEGDLAFFKSEKGKVTHVGIALGANKIIHASGFVRIDKIKKEGIWNDEMNKLTHICHSFKRII